MLRLNLVDADKVYENFHLKLYQKIPVLLSDQPTQTRVNIPETHDLTGLHIDYPQNIIRPTKEEYQRLLY